MICRNVWYIIRRGSASQSARRLKSPECSRELLDHPDRVEPRRPDGLGTRCHARALWYQVMYHSPRSFGLSANPDDVAKHDRMVSLVERMLDLHRRLPAASTEHARRPSAVQVEASARAPASVTRRPFTGSSRGGLLCTREYTQR